MDVQALMDIATAVSKLKMYPYFDVCNYILMCLMVREDNAGSTGGVTFSRKHPFACWVSSMLLCFASSIIANILVGESPLLPLKSNQDILTATAVWWLINYCPWDLVYKLVKIPPIKIIIYCLKEVQRVHKVHHGVHHAMKLFPGSYHLIVAIGVIKGAGYYYMRIAERLVRGIWSPSSHELLVPGFVTKSCALATILFILERKGIVDAPHELIYFGVVMFFINFRLAAVMFGLHDPFLPFENLICSVFFGGMLDALRKALGLGSEETTAKKND